MNLPARKFQDLVVWQKAHAFVLDVYRWTEKFPYREVYGLTSQLRRSSISIPANIVEGFKKRGTKDKLRFLNIAQGSLEESRYYLLLANDLGYGGNHALDDRIAEVSKLLEAYESTIKKSISKQ